MPNSRKCVLVLGMHRSGTSALAGLLHSLGVSMGKSLLEAEEINPKGFFENRNVYYFNELSLLPNLRTSAFDLKLPKAEFEAKKWDERLFLEAKNIIENDYMDLQLFGLKDPRISILLPFWSDVLDSLDIKSYYIIIVRSPFEVVASLRKIYDISVDEGYLIWINYYLSIFLHSSGKSRHIILFDNLVKVTGKVIDEMLIFLDIECGADTIDRAARFIDDRLRHNKRHDEFSSCAVADLANGMYDQLLTLCGEEGGVPNAESFYEIKKQYENILSDNLVVERNLRNELKRIGIDREELFHASEKRLRDVQELSRLCDESRVEINKLFKERDDLFEIAEVRLREIQSLVQHYDEVFDTAEKRLVEIKSLVKRCDDLYELAESRNDEIHSLVRKMDAVYENLKEVTDQKSMCEMRLNEIKQCVGYRMLKKLNAVK